MYECPIDYYIDNLIFNSNKTCWAVYRLKGMDYEYQSLEKKVEILYMTARYIAGIMSEAQILILPIGQDPKEHFDNLKKGISKSDPLYEYAMLQAESTREFLEEGVKLSGQANDYATYIVVKLEKNDEISVLTDLKDFWDYFIKEPVNTINLKLKMDTKDILLSKISKYERAANKWFKEADQRIQMEKIKTEEMQWLFRRVGFRGLEEKVPLFYKSKNEEWKPNAETEQIQSKKIVKPLNKDIVNLFSGTIKTGNRYLKIEHDGKTSYQSFLTLTNIPDEIDYPGNEWIYMLQNMKIEAEVCITCKAIEHKEAIRKLGYKKREIKSQMKNVAEAEEDMPEDLLEGRDYAVALESELKAAKFPTIKAAITICVADNELEKMEDKVIKVKNAYEDMNFTIERPIADQFKLFMQCIPSVSTTIKDYVLQITPNMLASGVIGATHELGDNQGPYIGTTGIEGKFVYLYMGLACLMNKSASATFYGNVGVGKSFSANLLLVLTVLYFGGYGLILDPKGERSHWAEELEIFKGLITIVKLTPDEEDKGKLDPYNIYSNEIDMANELAVNVLSELFKFEPNSDEYTVLLEAAKKMKDTKNEFKPSMERFTEILDTFDKEDDLYKLAKKVSRKIRLQKENGMCGLLFGDGTEQAISLDNRINILQIQNLKLPSSDKQKKDYSPEEAISTVLMMVISHFAKKFALIERDVFSLILFDESWSLGKTVEGVKLFDFLTRMGRSLFTGCIFNGHSVEDLPTEAIKNTITYKFCFFTDNDNEAERMVKYLGLEDTEENRSIIKNLGNGQCLFRDMNGHVGRLHFDAVFQDFIDVFSTTPKPRMIEEEKVILKKEVQKQDVVEEIGEKGNRKETNTNIENLEDIPKWSIDKDIDIFAEEKI